MNKAHKYVFATFKISISGSRVFGPRKTKENCILHVTVHSPSRKIVWMRQSCTYLLAKHVSLKSQTCPECESDPVLHASFIHDLLRSHTRSHIQFVRRPAEPIRNDNHFNQSFPASADPSRSF